MSKSPYYQVYIKKTKQDITSLISDFVHEDCLDEDDLVKFTLTDVNMDFIDNPDLYVGADLVFQYGYLSFKIRNAATCQIRRIEPRYASSLTMTITCLDRGAMMKKTTSCKIWKNLTASEIVAQIVKRYSLTLVSDPTTKKYVSLPQGNRTDFEFIRYLTTIEGSGSYLFYIKDFDAFFKKRDLQKEPAITFTYGYPDGKIISFVPVESDEGDKNGKDSTKVSGVNPLTGEKISETVTPETQAEGEGFLGNASGFLEEKPKGQDPASTTGQNVPVPAKTKDEAKAAANKVNKSSKLKELTATLIIEGDTLIRAGDLVTMKGVGKKYIGNWYIKKVTNRINGGGFQTELQMEKSLAPANTNKDKVNKKTGANDGNQKKEIFLYNKDGIRIQ